MANFGFRKSEINGSEHLFGMANTSLPDVYSYKNYLSPVLNQGNLPICVPCSVSTYINWKLNLEDGSKKDYHIAYAEIYKAKTMPEDGMTFKDAFRFLLKSGVTTDNGNFKIGEYGLVRSEIQLKNALLLNGPCFAALPVYNWGPYFWEKESGDSLMGYHAICIVGYNNDGFIIRNSWGKSFGEGGYTEILYEDFYKLLEIWTIMS